MIYFPEGIGAFGGAGEMMLYHPKRAINDLSYHPKRAVNIRLATNGFNVHPDMKETMFRRKAWDELKEWKDKWSGRYAVLVEGPRRVGKTTLVKEFVASEYKSSVFIDFSENDPDLIAIFEASSSLDMFFRLLQDRSGITLYERESAIVFDEVQLYPKARQKIKHLVEDGRYDYIETGCLVSIGQNVRDILIPSEEMSISMRPMDFEEFAWAVGAPFPTDYLKECFDNGTPVASAIHGSLMRSFATYMVVGGMPQSVEEYIRSGSFSRVDAVKRDILKVYRTDMSRVREPTRTKVRAIYKQMPDLLSSHAKAFSPSKIKAGSRTRDYLNAIDWLSESKIVNICYRCTDPDPALDFCPDVNSFKIYMADTGLLMAAAFMSNNAKDEAYRMVLDNKLSSNRGMMFENAVAQELAAHGHTLAFSKRRSEANTYGLEVDFILADGKHLIPVEVKSGEKSSSHKSLDVFIETYGRKVDRAYVIHSKNLRVDGKVVYIPIYMTIFL